MPYSLQKAASSLLPGTCITSWKFPVCLSWKPAVRSPVQMLTRMAGRYCAGSKALLQLFRVFLKNNPTAYSPYASCQCQTGFARAELKGCLRRKSGSQLVSSLRS